VDSAPRPATASAALQNGEVDWWETPITDLVPLLRMNRNLVVDIADPLGNIRSFRMNHLHPPFSDARARHAILLALTQGEPSFFTPGTPLYTEEGGAILKGQHSLDAAKPLLSEVAILVSRSPVLSRKTSHPTKPGAM
jgi:peptide/nickel transport system substrate-binding protein